MNREPGYTTYGLGVEVTATMTKAGYVKMTGQGLCRLSGGMGQISGKKRLEQGSSN